MASGAAWGPASRKRLDGADDATRAGLRARLRRERGASASIGTVWASPARTLFEHLTRGECAAYFRQCGCAQSA